MLVQVARGVLVKVFACSKEGGEGQRGGWEYMAEGGVRDEVDDGSGADWIAGDEGSCDPISKIVIPVPDLREALLFWQFAIGLNSQASHCFANCLFKSACLVCPSIGTNSL